MMPHVRLGMWCIASSCLVVDLVRNPLHAQAPAQQPAPRKTQADDYTSYELVAPETRQFRILYDVTATTPGATVYLTSELTAVEGNVDSLIAELQTAIAEADAYLAEMEQARTSRHRGAVPDASRAHRQT